MTRRCRRGRFCGCWKCEISFPRPALSGRSLSVLNGINSPVMATDVEGMVALLKMPRPFRGPAQVDRRLFPRREVHAQLRAAKVDPGAPGLDALRNANLTLYLRDLSLGGMSAISPTPLQQGERLSL